MKRVYLEITNACNLNCSFCTNKKGTTFMSLDDIDNYLNQIKEFSNYIYLHVLGEPLLHPNFDQILKLLDEKDFNLQLVTNGILLNKYPNLLSHKCLRKLSISLHSINNINVSDDYFDYILKLIKNNNDKIIELRFYDLNNLDDKLTEFLNGLESLYGLESTKKNQSYKIKDKVYIYHQEMFNWPDINDTYIGENGLCHGLKDQIAILHDATVTACCLDSCGINKIGDLNTDSLKDILDSPLYKEALIALNNKKLLLPLCKHCTYRLRFNK